MKMRGLILLVLLAFLGKYAEGLEIRGRVIIGSSGCPIAGLTVEIDPEKGSNQIKGCARRQQIATAHSPLAFSTVGTCYKSFRMVSRFIKTLWLEAESFQQTFH